jgi:hypothetical protein
MTLIDYAPVGNATIYLQKAVLCLRFSQFSVRSSYQSGIEERETRFLFFCLTLYS